MQIKFRSLKLEPMDKSFFVPKKSKLRDSLGKDKYNYVCKVDAMPKHR